MTQNNEQEKLYKVLRAAQAVPLGRQGRAGAAVHGREDYAPDADDGAGVPGMLLQCL